ncbi:hypothetical protein AVEN_84061-1, partial [Araneus ventricosus]
MCAVNSSSSPLSPSIFSMARRRIATVACGPIYFTVRHSFRFDSYTRSWDLRNTNKGQSEQ